MTNGSALIIENCEISNFSADAVYVMANTTVRVINTVVRNNAGSGLYFLDGVTADIANSKILNNGWVGVWANPNSTGNVMVSVEDTVSSGNSVPEAANMPLTPGPGTLLIQPHPASAIGARRSAQLQKGALMHARVKALPTLAVLATLAALPSYAVQRTFVASFGNDANTATNCGFATPCRGFTAAQTITDPGGEVIALDAAGYGNITITKSITLTSNPGFYAGIAASSGNAVTIATAGVVVILRGLNINGLGGVFGVSMTNGTSLAIENCVISNFTNDGVHIVSAGSYVRISDSTIRGNGGNGILGQGGAVLDVSRSSMKGNAIAGVWISADTGATTTIATVSDSDSSGNFNGFVSVALIGTTGTANLAISRSTSTNNSNDGALAEQDAGTVVLTISGSIVSGNGFGLGNISGTLESQGNNTVRQNSGGNTIGTITTFAGT
jgi:Right handed beta helix region